VSELVTAIFESEGIRFAGEALETLPSGAPIYVHRISGKLGLASALAIDKATVVGLASVAIASGSVGDVDTEQHEESDWTAITGTAALLVGLPYYVGDTPGTLTAVAPTVPGKFCAAVGVAASATVLELNLQPPIAL